MTRAFALHAQLAADTVVVGDLPLSRVLLMNDARFPWVILVPRRVDLVEYLDLDEDECSVLHAELRRVGAGLQALYAPDKLNVAALGNKVPQLHVHVIGRRRDDAAWPNPVWGTPAVPYAPDQAARRVDELREAFRLRD